MVGHHIWSWPYIKTALGQYILFTGILVNAIHWTDAGLMLGQRRRRWTNVKPTLVPCMVLTGMSALLKCHVVYSDIIITHSQYVGSMLAQCWAIIAHDGPALGGYRVDVLCLFGYSVITLTSLLYTLCVVCHPSLRTRLLDDVLCHRVLLPLTRPVPHPHLRHPRRPDMPEPAP